ncbi:MAG: hypothetical protein ABSH33_14150 [Steroidobacteraceae bacterium]|jgi:hypothetical protein
MATQRARSPRNGNKIDLQSLHARFNQVRQIAQCLAIAIESERERIEPAAVCRAIVDMLDDINSDLWTFLEPSLFHRIDAKETARKNSTQRNRAHVIFDSLRVTNGLHDGNGAFGNGSNGSNGSERASAEDSAN